MNDDPTRLNRLAIALRDVCLESVLEEKWLLAPTVRVGFQWMESVARSGVPAFNVRVKTLLHMALDLASPAMAALGAAYLRGPMEEVLLGRVFAGIGAEYLADLAPGPGLLRALRTSVRDLRIGGVTSGSLQEKHFEAGAKGRDVRRLLSGYEGELERGRFLDYADVLREASRRLARDPGALPPGTMVLLPEDMEAELAGLERALWNAVPAASRRVLPVDRPDDAFAGDRPDASLLRHVLEPVRAPAPARDGTAALFRAAGEENEVREVFRRCLRDRLPLDEVEVLYTDSERYLPLIYETAWTLGAEDHESLPVTFSEGVPPCYSRPGRALTGWLAWLGEGFSQSVLWQMIRDGLLEFGKADGAGIGFSRLAEVFHAVPIGGGRDRLVPSLDRELHKCAIRLRREAEGREAGADRGADGRRERYEGLKELRGLVVDLLGWVPVGDSAQDRRALLEGTAAFLDSRARRADRFDAYCHEQLVKKIREMHACLEDRDMACLDVRRWLADLCASSHVAGTGPRPGRLFVAPLHLGGHSGRKHTFVVGMDDGRFPGGGSQDPLLLDMERRRISGDLPTAAGRLSRRASDLARLFSRVRGAVTMSYSCLSIPEDRDQFPSPLFLSAFRILSGKREGDLEDLVRDVGDPVSFAPEGEDGCLNRTEWWLWRTCAHGPIEDPRQAVAEHYPHLRQGFAARLARESDRFTEYDGNVPEAASETDPTIPEGPVLSARRLELLGLCPMEYFFRYVLGVMLPEEYRIDPNVWLDAAKRGELLHEVFRRFMSRIVGDGRRPEFSRDEMLLDEILAAEIERAREENPPPCREVFEREVRSLRQAARIFLMEEEAYCRHGRPLHFEVSVGLPQVGDGTPLDSKDPVILDLHGGGSVRIRGRIDRVDEAPGEGGKRFTVWDYKTGSTWKYTTESGARKADPFDQGRLVQNVVYTAMAEARLREVVSPEAAVDRFGYFFPDIRAHGERIAWSGRELSGGGVVLADLCRMLSEGCFPFTDRADDMRYSDYLSAFGDVKRAAAASARKASNPENGALAAFSRLRGYELEDGSE